MKKGLSILAGCLLATAVVQVPHATAQPPGLPLPRASQAASVAQTIGITKITISYHRPVVKNRKIWGEMVPFGEVWRGGANENTTISFSDPVKIQGKDLPAGTYGLHLIPTAGDWTIIFSKNSTSWGSFYYKEEEDALRVRVTPTPSEHQEWLSYDFTNVEDQSVVVALRWEKLRIAFKVDIDVPSTVVSYIRTIHLRGLAGFSWQGYNDAASYCLRNNINLDEALQWSTRSIELAENYNNLRTKAGLLEKLGRNSESKPLRDRAMSIATEVDINALGYEYLGNGKMKEAIDTFKKNVRDYPGSWNVHDSLGEAYEKNGDAKLAVEAYSKALKLVKDDTNKKRITQILQRLQTKI